MAAVSQFSAAPPRGQAGADVEELVDAHLTGEILDGTNQERAVVLGDLADAGKHLEILVTSLGVWNRERQPNT